MQTSERAQIARKHSAVQKVRSYWLRSGIQSGCMDGVIPARAQAVAACNYGGTLQPRQLCGSVHWQSHTVELVCNCSTAASLLKLRGRIFLQRHNGGIHDPLRSAHAEFLCWTY